MTAFYPPPSISALVPLSTPSQPHQPRRQPSEEVYILPPPSSPSTSTSTSTSTPSPSVASHVQKSTPAETPQFVTSAQCTSSGDFASRFNRLSLASIARDKTSSVFSGLAVRTRASSNSLHSSYSAAGLTRQASPGSPSTADPPAILPNTKSSLPSIPASPTPVNNRPDNRNTSRSESEIPRVTLDLPSTDRRRLLDRSPSPTPSAPVASYPQGSHNKMHQTSSRLLRMTDEERPFTRDFKDLFSTLMVSLPLGPHRVRFQKIEHTFTSEEAINNLGSLKFSQSNRMPDPKDPSRIVTTTTTTTFSMAKEMARSVCMRFVDARFIETADGKPVQGFPLKGAVWQLTPKGMHVLTRFCQRNGINQRHVLEVLDSPRNSMHLVVLERDAATDKLSQDRATIEVIFRRFAGDNANTKLSTATADSDSLNDFYNGLIGVKMAKDRKIGDRVYAYSFTGKAAIDWLMDCCTTVDRREAFEVADLFVQHGHIVPVVEDKVYANQNPGAARFQPTKNALYVPTEKGQRVAGWIPSTNGDARGDALSQSNNTRPDGRPAPRDSNHNRLLVIVTDPALRLLFREFLRDTHCEENLAFYLEVREFTKAYDTSEKAGQYSRLDAIRESLAQAYGKMAACSITRFGLISFRALQCFPCTGFAM